ncbi:hypothetical protein ACFOY2_54235 [Nonomuraea purpurea]|uniref:Ig-like domain-containing protein n=1 Tax=Nonomuraea purpurea TaxID=1849276 RepID=A0ABV8GU45_9ACTN
MKISGKTYNNPAKGCYDGNFWPLSVNNQTDVPISVYDSRNGAGQFDGVILSPRIGNFEFGRTVLIPGNTPVRKLSSKETFMKMSLPSAVLSAMAAAAIVTGTAAPAAHAADPTIKINSAKATGDRTASVSVTYTCSASQPPIKLVGVLLRFGWGTAGGSVDPVCDGASHTVSVPAQSTFNPIRAGDSVTVTATLENLSLPRSPENWVAMDQKQLTLT